MVVQLRICSTKSCRLPRHDREQLYEHNATTSHVDSSERQSVWFAPAELHSIEMVGALRARLQRSHVARMKQRALPFPVVPKMYRRQVCIEMLHLYCPVCFVFCFGCQLPVPSYFRVKPDNYHS